MHRAMNINNNNPVPASLFVSSSLSSIILLSFHAAAQPSSPGVYQTGITASSPSTIFIRVGIISVIIILTLLLTVYATCRRHTSAAANAGRDLDRQQSNRNFSPQKPRLSGVKKEIIESLPLFKFSSLRGSREGLQECAVCLLRFEDAETLRMLPKCKHAFHLDCVGEWLESHSTCPLCRHKVEAEDLTMFNYSSSSRFLFRDHLSLVGDQLELFVERQPSGRHGLSLGFNIGSSFRKAEKRNKDQEITEELHKAVVSDFEFRTQWGDVNPSDLMFLNSEMLGVISSNRFSSSALDSNSDVFVATGNGSPSGERNSKISEEMEMKRLLESRVVTQNNRSDQHSVSCSGWETNVILSSTLSGKNRSMSEIMGLGRFTDQFVGRSRRANEISNLISSNAKDEKV